MEEKLKFNQVKIEPQHISSCRILLAYKLLSCLLRRVTGVEVKIDLECLGIKMVVYF